MPINEHLLESLWKQHKQIAMALIGNSTDTLRACLHKDGRPQVGEVTLVAVVEKQPLFNCNLTSTGSRGEASGALAMI